MYKNKTITFYPSKPFFPLPHPSHPSRFLLSLTILPFSTVGVCVCECVCVGVVLGLFLWGGWGRCGWVYTWHSGHSSNTMQTSIFRRPAAPGICAPPPQSSSLRLVNLATCPSFINAACLTYRVENLRNPKVASNHFLLGGII